MEVQLNGNTHKLTYQELECLKLWTSHDKAYLGNQTACFEAVFATKRKLAKSSLYVMASNFFNQEHIKKALTDMVNESVSPDKIKKNLQRLAENAKYDRDKLKGWELLGKTHAMFTDNVKTDVKIEGLYGEMSPDDESDL